MLDLVSLKRIDSMNYSVHYYNVTMKHPLHLSTVLNVDRVVYLTPNMIFVNSPDKIWSSFDQFDARQAIGLTPQCKVSGTNLFIYSPDMCFQCAPHGFDSHESFGIDLGHIDHLSAENVYFLPYNYVLDPDHCQSIEDIVLISQNSDHSVFRAVYKTINEIDLSKSNAFDVWLRLIEKELTELANDKCLYPLLQLMVAN